MWSQCSYLLSDHRCVSVKCILISLCCSLVAPFYKIYSTSKGSFYPHLLFVRSWDYIYISNKSSISKLTAKDVVNIRIFSETTKMFLNIFSGAKIVHFLQTFLVFYRDQQPTGYQRWTQICVGVQKGKCDAFLS